MKLSAYGYLFNATIREFDLDGAITNFTAFFDETVIATIPSEDDTHERLLAWEAKLPGKLKIVMTDIKLSNNRFDGDLKTAALQACTKSTPEDPCCYVIMDADETVALEYRQIWDLLAMGLHKYPLLDGLFIPVIDLWGDEKHAKEQVGYKFRMHKDTVVKRGVIPEAERENGLFDTSKSDSTEPLLANGQLARFSPIQPQVRAYVIHWGHLDQQRRAKLNREFWRGHWKNRSGEEPTMVLNVVDKIEEPQVKEHGLSLR